MSGAPPILTSWYAYPFEELCPGAEELEKWRTGVPGYETTDHYPLVVNNPNATSSCGCGSSFAV